MSDKFRISRKFEIHSEEIPDEMLISDVESIEAGGVAVTRKEDLARLVEGPLLQACQELYDKGIKTIFSSANKQDVSGGAAYITIDFDSLSPANQKLAESLGEIHMTHGSVPSRAVNIEIPISETSTVGDVRRMAAKIVARFEIQT